MTGLGQLLPGKANVLNHLEMKHNRKVILDTIIKGTKINETDTKLFTLIAKFLENSQRFIR